MTGVDLTRPETLDPREVIAHWRRDPVAFVRDNFKVEPDAWQVDALLAFADPSVQLISLQACAGPGKSAVLAWCGWYFLSCWGEPGEHPKGFCVAITGDNLASNLWPEYAKWQQKSPYLLACFTWTSERIFSNEHKATWFLEARSWPKTANAEEQGKTLSGLHGKYVLVQVDESGAIPGTVARTAKQCLAGHVAFGKVLQAGNPLMRDGMLGDASSSPEWRVIRITGDPDDPRRSPRIPIEWARQQIAQYGRENPWVMAYILGQFPPGALNALLGPDEVRDAMARGLSSDYDAISAHAPKILGVDVAREGDDQSVIVLRQGRRAIVVQTLRNVDSLQGAGAVAAAWTEHKADACFIDNSGGWGGGWIDQLRAIGRQPIPVSFAGEPNDKRFYNKRMEMWWQLAQWVKEGGALPPHSPTLVRELSGPTYSFKGDRLLLEEKKQLKARIQCSPDTADALALTFAQPVYKPSVLDGHRPEAKPYDPLDGMDSWRTWRGQQ